MKSARSTIIGLLHIRVKLNYILDDNERISANDILFSLLKQS